MEKQKMNVNERNGYAFHNAWFSFAETEAEVKPIPTALYLFYVHLNNTIGWKIIEFGAPTEHTMEVLGIGNRNTFKSAFNDLLRWGFVELITESTNQHHARRIKLCLCKNEQAKMNRQCTSTDAGTEHINKLLNYKTSKIEEEELLLLKRDFENFNEALEIYLKSAMCVTFKKKYGLTNDEVICRFRDFWDYQEALSQLNYTQRECFAHFYRWHPKNLKAEEENKIRVPEWKKDWVSPN